MWCLGGVESPKGYIFIKLHFIKLQKFFIFMYFLWCFCVESLSNPPHAKTPYQASWQSLAIIINKSKILKILTKWPPVATTVPFDTSTVIKAFVYWVCLRIYDQSHHLPGLLAPLWLQGANSVSNGRPHLQLYCNMKYILTTKRYVT